MSPTEHTCPRYDKYKKYQSELRSRPHKRIQLSLLLFLSVNSHHYQLTMDLGFGKENQVVGEAVNRVLSEQTKAHEAAIDDELNRYDSLLEDETALETLRKRRLEHMKQQQKQRQEWKSLGHGKYRDLVDSKNVDAAKAFFETTKQSDRVVVHFYRPTTTTCDILHNHLQKLASQHLETKFVKINVEGCEQGSNGASFLVEKLGIVILPTLVLIKNRKVIHHLHGFISLKGVKSLIPRRWLMFLGRMGS
jgi:thiol-disulfide isomerase/thioredoxin